MGSALIIMQWSRLVPIIIELNCVQYNRKLSKYETLQNNQPTLPFNSLITCCYQLGTTPHFVITVKALSGVALVSHVAISQAQRLTSLSRSKLYRE